MLQLVYFLLILLVVSLIVWILFGHQRAVTSSTRVAELFGGQIADTGFLQQPSIKFSHRGARVQVDSQGTGGSYGGTFVRFEIGWPHPALRCELVPERFFNRLGKLLGMNDIEVGFPQFDRDYVISGNDPEAIRALLTPEVQQLIDGLRELRGNDDIHVAIRGGLLQVRKRGRMRDEPSLETFIRESLELYDKALIGLSAGVEIVEQADARLEAPPICQVCGEPVAREVVFCRACKTAHHRDCWDYVGSCSTYGCGETKCRKPKQMARDAH